MLPYYRIDKLESTHNKKSENINSVNMHMCVCVYACESNLSKPHCGSESHGQI